jgi:hypothetical protein
MDAAQRATVSVVFHPMAFPRFVPEQLDATESAAYFPAMQSFAILLLAIAALPLGAQERNPKGQTRIEHALPSGTFVASRIDRETMPVKDQVVDEDGTLYFIEFDRMVLTLRDDQTFRASVRYRRTLFSADPRGRSRATPLQSVTVTGRYDVGGGLIRFSPDASNETRGLRIMNGTVTNTRELSVPFNYRNGTAERRRTLVMMRRDNIL